MTTTKTKQTKTNTAEAKASSAASKVETSIDKLPANPFAFEVLSLVSKQRTNAKKVEVLKKYEHDSLKSIFIWNFTASSW